MELEAGSRHWLLGLAEPTAGSDPSSMAIFARRDGEGWVLNGAKRWIGMATIAHLAIIWGQMPEGVRGFLVPVDTLSFSAWPIVGELNNCREAVRICREARSILGGNGIALEYSPLRHANNLESVRTSEGIDEIYALGLGSHVTGIRVFSWEPVGPARQSRQFGTDRPLPNALPRGTMVL